MEILWPPAYFTDGNKTIFLFDIYYMAYLSYISYAVISFQGRKWEKRENVFSAIKYTICGISDNAIYTDTLKLMTV